VPALLDTSLVVRYLTDDPPHLAEIAEAIITEQPDLEITDVALAEVSHVLASTYGLPRAEVIDSLVELLGRDNITTFRLDKAIVIEALHMCRSSGRVSVPDALIWAAARSAGGLTVFSLDRRFPSQGIEVLPPLVRAQS